MAARLQYRNQAYTSPGGIAVPIGSDQPATLNHLAQHHHCAASERTSRVTLNTIPALALRHQPAPAPTESRAEWAAHYIAAGYAPIPIPAGEKRPTLPDWPHYSVDADRDFLGEGNIGLLAGARSGGLVDVDLDCPEAIEAAKTLLPPTGMRHGRRSKPASHYWYRVTDDLPVTRTAFVDEAGTLVELRSSDGSKGVQTVVPPSIHPSGEPVVWERYGTPAEVGGQELDRRVRLVAVVALLARHWPREGLRHQVSLALSGYLLNGGLDEAEVAEIVSLAAEIAGDEEAEARRGNVGTTARRVAAGELVVGGTAVAEHLGERVMQQLTAWLGIRRPVRTSALRGLAPAASTGVAGCHDMAPELEFSDTGNALRLAWGYGARLRFVHQWGWLVYREGRWRRDETGYAMQCAKACIGDLLKEAVQPDIDRTRRDLLLDHARRSYQANRLQAMLKLAESETGIAAQVEDFDRDPWLLNVQNGTLDLRTQDLRPHNPDDLITRIAPVVYDPEATAPRWERFLSEVFARDGDLVAFVQRAFGYSLTGVTREQVFFTCWGAGCNGKSTMLNAVAGVMGDYTKPLKADALMAHPFKNAGGADPEIASLVGARLVTAQEPKSGELDTAKVKELTGQDTIQVRELYKTPFTFVPQFKLWLSTNERPVVSETTTGIWRRLKLIPFTVSFEKGKDERLPEALRAEASGILNWLLAGCRTWQQDLLGEAKAVREATREYREEEDPYMAFFSEVLCRAGAASRVELQAAYQAYEDWRGEADAPYLSDKVFAKQAEAHGFTKLRSNGKRYLVGCVLRDASAGECR